MSDNNQRDFIEKIWQLTKIHRSLTKSVRKNIQEATAQAGGLVPLISGLSNGVKARDSDELMNDVRLFAQACGLAAPNEQEMASLFPESKLLGLTEAVRLANKALTLNAKDIANTIAMPTGRNTHYERGSLGNKLEETIETKWNDFTKAVAKMHTDNLRVNDKRRAWTERFLTEHGEAIRATVVGNPLFLCFSCGRELRQYFSPSDIPVTTCETTLRQLIDGFNTNHNAHDLFLAADGDTVKKMIAKLPSGAKQELFGNALKHILNDHPFKKNSAWTICAVSFAFNIPCDDFPDEFKRTSVQDWMEDWRANSKNEETPNPPAPINLWHAQIALTDNLRPYPPKMFEYLDGDCDNSRDHTADDIKLASQKAATADALIKREPLLAMRRILRMQFNDPRFEDQDKNRSVIDKLKRDISTLNDNGFLANTEDDDFLACMAWHFAAKGSNFGLLDTDNNLATLHANHLVHEGTVDALAARLDKFCAREGLSREMSFADIAFNRTRSDNILTKNTKTWWRAQNEGAYPPELDGTPWARLVKSTVPEAEQTVHVATKKKRP